MRNAIVLSLALFVVAAFVQLAVAQGTYTQIDYPGVTNGTYVYGINAAGDIVGNYADENFHYHGFVLSDGSYTQIDYPGAPGIALLGINDVGQIVGQTTRHQVVSFLYNMASQTFTTIRYPHASETFVYGINNAGTVVGYYAVCCPEIPFGFEAAGSTYRQLIPPGAVYSDARGISSSGKVVGGAGARDGSTSNILFKRGNYYRITIPVGPNYAVYGINPAGTALVGYSYPPASGFLYKGQALQTLQFPGAFSTLAYGVNDAGEVVGTFQDSSLLYHGFRWTPHAGAARR